MLRLVGFYFQTKAFVVSFFVKKIELHRLTMRCFFFSALMTQVNAGSA
jgi:hypothetical protein